jgi:hypothetical protein
MPQWMGEEVSMQIFRGVEETGGWRGRDYSG